ncbi:hypothetical protein BN7_1406 [Wickerhamomyces ciferrii]|uniref:Uncharacterized protein n=1 Tax=Wickerhamomyces ciferrii (strain ATCC 14091 / BCRC 22168 / CBS 111 / JCM 3599 / NBRC 0793 / NRRL Y-1031 F-60-10) TaxID=1206466 RepID=K0KI78_WICCF|nr:uncharacterized protein BN7_1406 [Wickerhamomyces ciferrii]CCH41867.1 hypothetical protein BN7_1406 [Wickerhamomyces ciferrii]
MANNNIKKIAKHSKRFERTQTGCLQCRQKKIFQFNKDSLSRKNSLNESKKSFKEIDLKKNQEQDQKDENVIIDDDEDNHEVEEHNIEIDEDEDEDLIETQQSLNSLGEKIEQILDDKEMKPIDINHSRNDTIISELNSRSDSITSLISDSGSDINNSNTITQPSTPPPSTTHGLILNLLQPSNYKISQSQRATNMIHDGESINKILDDMTIELIKKSINNLQYINFDQKLNNYQKSNESSNWNLIDGDETKFKKHHDKSRSIEVIGNDDDYFDQLADDFLSFD